MWRNKLRVRQKLDYFLDFQKLINSKSKTRKAVPLLEKLINSKSKTRKIQIFEGAAGAIFFYT